MAAAQKEDKLKIKLNLLHTQGLPEKLPVKFLKWLVNYGRYIVVLVEIIVLVAFVARFKLDADLAEIKRKARIMGRSYYVRVRSGDNVVRSGFTSVEVL